MRGREEEEKEERAEKRSPLCALLSPIPDGDGDEEKAAAKRSEEEEKGPRERRRRKEGRGNHRKQRQHRRRRKGGPSVIFQPRRGKGECARTEEGRKEKVVRPVHCVCECKKCHSFRRPEGDIAVAAKKGRKGLSSRSPRPFGFIPPSFCVRFFFAPSFLPLPPIFLREGKGGREGLSKTSPRPVKSNGRRTYKGEEERRGKGPEAPLTLREKGKKGALDTKDFLGGGKRLLRSAAPPDSHPTCRKQEKRGGRREKLATSKTSEPVFI